MTFQITNHELESVEMCQLLQGNKLKVYID